MKKIYSFALTAVFLLSASTITAQKGRTLEGSSPKNAAAVNKLLTSDDQIVLKEAEKLEVLAVGGKIGDWIDFEKQENQKLNETDKFHGYKITKTVDVSKKKERETLTELIFASVGKGETSRCFEPRHGVRATYKGKIVEFLICFECGYIYAFNANGYKYDSIGNVPQNSLNIFLRKGK